MKLKKVFLLSLILSLFSFSVPTQACGCGLMISATEKGWEYGDDSTENAFIVYEDGIEHMLIGLDIQKRDTGAVLITPVPAPPEETKADILSQVPSFTGYNVQEKALENLGDIELSLYSTQIYPIFAIGIFNLLNSSTGLSDVPFGNIPTDLLDKGIDVYQHIEKEGMVAEVLTAKTSDELYSYLQEKGLNVVKDSIPVFKDYIDEDFSFVVAWIDPTKDNLSAKGVTATFPTKEIFYPLKPNSAYQNSQQKPKNIIVLGYKTPTIYTSIEDDTQVEYLYSESGLTFEDFINTEKGFGFTKIVINTNPQNMQEDLYIKNISPINITLAHAINQWVLAFDIFLLIIISTIATRLSLRIVKPLYTLPKVSFYKLVLFNSLTLLGTAIATGKYIATSKGKYIMVFSIVFVITTLILISIFKLFVSL